MLTGFYTDLSPYITGLFFFNLMIAFTIIFLERKNPAATLAWIMILFILPGVGIVAYFLLSQNIARQKIFHLTRYEETIIHDQLENQVLDFHSRTFRFSNPEASKWQDMIHMHQTYSNSFYTQDNSVAIFTDGREKFNSLFEDLRNAKSSINIMYYIVKYDELGISLIKLLTQKAREGVEVRFLMDALGGRQIFRRHLREFMEAGGRYAYFFEPKFRIINLKLNYRNHRKLVIIDDEIGYLGGFNVANEYVGKIRKFGYWRDTHLKIVGSAVQDMQARFLLDWRFASKEKLTLSQVFYGKPPSKGSTGIQIVSCGPESSKEEVKYGYLKMVYSSKKNIYIQTPYFVPDESLLEVLKAAVLSGIDLRIMIPCKPDHMFVYWATYSYIGELLDAGARVFIYENGFLHAKTICVDGEIASVGSANFDIRSFRLNFEVNAFLYDAQATWKLESSFLEDMTHCRELTRDLYQKRSMGIRVKEKVSRLLSDLL